jgi:hypothetical protein
MPFMQVSPNATWYVFPLSTKENQKGKLPEYTLPSIKNTLLVLTKEKETASDNAFSE